MHPSRPLVLTLVAAMALGLLPAATAAAASPEKVAPPEKVALPTVTGPVDGEFSLLSTGFDLASQGYEAEEYFLEGTATSYKPDGTLRSDGKWSVTADATAPYKTRIVVYRPVKPKDFDGTVFVEWLNITSGSEFAPDWGFEHVQAMRAGNAWVTVSAQAAGVQGGQETVAGVPAGGVKAADPERYGSLTHPGDAFSYDIFSQAGLAAAGKTTVDPMAGYDVKRVIAVGASQSAFRLVTYANAVQPLAGVYDGLFVHSRSASGAGFTDSKNFGLGDAAVPKSTVIRNDLDVPVLTLETETDVSGLGFFPARQPDAKRFRLWEVAGAAHADAYVAGLSFVDVGDGAVEKTLLDTANIGGGPLGCTAPINAGPDYAVARAAVAHLERWVRDGTPPPKAPRLDVTAGKPPLITRDQHGIATHGIRTPFVDAPTATLDGEGNAGGSFCGLFGNTKVFDAATLAALYPTHADYVKKFDAATDKAVKAGFILPPEAKLLKAAAESAPIGS